MYEYRAKVKQIVDGNTIIVGIVLGFGVFKNEKIRFRGIKSPEIEGEERVYGMESKDALTKFILNKEIIIKTYKESVETGCEYNAH